jgi:hypothetical protein
MLEWRSFCFVWVFVGVCVGVFVVLKVRYHTLLYTFGRACKVFSRLEAVMRSFFLTTL